MKAIILGLISSLFFASSFILNRAMELGGGSWIWSGVLRYLFMIPPLLLIVLYRGNLKGLLVNMKQNIKAWLLWSTVGFGIFYAPICFAAAYGPSWLVASTWQITIIAGPLLVPLFYEIVETADGPKLIRGRIPLRGMLFSTLILAGVVLMQIQQAAVTSLNAVLLGGIPVLAAAFAYPLGNRKMMMICGDSLDTFQRVLGMTIASMPFWFILSIYGTISSGLPNYNQLVQSSLVALFSGVIATSLFFRATDLVRNDNRKLAAVEATQSGEVLFALLGEILFLKGAVPVLVSFVGIALVILGMILHSYGSHHAEKRSEASDNSYDFIN